MLFINIMDIDKWLNTDSGNHILNKEHVNMLFKKMMDCTYDNNFNYKVYDNNSKKRIKCDILDSSMEGSFNDFCYNHSVKFHDKELLTRPSTKGTLIKKI